MKSDLNAVRIFRTALLAGVFGIVTIVPAQPVFSATGSGWSTTKVTNGGSAGAYCALSRQVDETTITIGRTVRGHSSLALEMKNAKLDPKRVYRLSLKPGNADRLEIEAKPVNGQTFVLNLDQVVDLPASFSASPTLQIRYDDVSMALSLPNWKAGATDLESCLSALSGDKAPATKTNKNAKVETRVEEVAVTPRVPEPKPVSAPVPVTPVPASTPSAVQNKAAAALRGERDELARDLARAREEIALLKSSRSADLAETDAQKKERQDAQMRLSTLQAENENLRASLRARELEQEKTTVQTDETQKLKDEITALKAENQRVVKSETPPKDSETTGLAKLKAENEKLGAEAAKLRTENIALGAEKAALSARVDEATKSTMVTKVEAAKLAELQTQRDKAQAEADMLRVRVTELSAKPKGPDLADLQRRLEALTSENVKLRAELASATVPEAEMRVSVAAEAPLRQQLRDMRSENESLRARTSELVKLLDQNQNGTDSARIKASGKNWDLEQATRRLQESEREVQRLSLTLRDSKAQCEAQKKEIEYMLFDPKLAKDGQIALLNALEDEIAMLRAGKAPPSVASSAPVAPAAVMPKLPISSAPSVNVAVEPLAAPASVAALPASPGPVGISALLKQAGIGITRAVEPLAKNPFGAGKAWGWETETLAGLATEQPGVKPAAFDGTVSAQIKTLKSKCKGDFAATPALSGNTSVGGLTYAAYDAACIAGANSTSAALLFYQKGDRFNLISHEAAPDSMGDAMDARDRLVTTLAGK